MRFGRPNFTNDSPAISSGITLFGGGGSRTTTSTSTTKLPAWLNKHMQDVSKIQKNELQDYLKATRKAPKVAGLTRDHERAMRQMALASRSVGRGRHLMEQSLKRAKGATRDADKAADRMGEGIIDARGSTRRASQAFQRGEKALSDLNFYRDPYTEKVIDANIADMQDEFERQNRVRGAGAASAGAFGGSRHGVADAISNRLAGREIGDMTNKMRSEAERYAAEMALKRGAGIMEAGQGHLGTADRHLARSAMRGQQADRYMGVADRFRGQGQDHLQGGIALGSAQQSRAQAFSNSDALRRQISDRKYNSAADNAARRLAATMGAPSAATNPSLYASQTQTTTAPGGQNPMLGLGLAILGGGLRFSSAELKENIDRVPSGEGLARVLDLDPTEYNYIDEDFGEGRRRGFIAEEVEEVDPEAVSMVVAPNGEVYRAVDPFPIIADLTDAVQTLNDRLEDVEDVTVLVEDA